MLTLRRSLTLSFAFAVFDALFHHRSRLFIRLLRYYYALKMMSGESEKRRAQRRRDAVMLARVRRVRCARGAERRERLLDAAICDAALMRDMSVIARPPCLRYAADVAKIMAICSIR